MATEFVVLVSDPRAAHSQLCQWAASNHFQLVGDSSTGNFAGTPSGLAGMLYGEIRGQYSTVGDRVIIQVNKDLPVGEVRRRLAQFGLVLVSYS